MASASALASDVHSLEATEESLDGPTSLSRRLAAAKLSGDFSSTGDGSGETDETDNLDEEKEVKLLRLRTKGREVVVVVEREWLLVVVNGVEKGKGGVV